MRSWKVAVVLAVISLLLAFALAAAQEPVRDFSQLNTRLVPGDTVWVSDAQGREVKGRILSLGTDALALEGGGRTYGPSDVASIQVRRADSLRNGALIGLGVGGGLVLAACLANAESGTRVGACWAPRFTAASARASASASTRSSLARNSWRIAQPGPRVCPMRDSPSLPSSPPARKA